MANIPSPLTYGTLVAFFIKPYADSADAGSEPDLLPVTGSIILTPVVGLMRGAASSPKFIALSVPIECPIIDGYLCSPGSTTSDIVNQGVRVIATDSAGLNPSPVQYIVSFNLDDVPNQPPALTIDIPAGTTTDLSTVIPSETPGVVTVVSELWAIPSGGTTGQALVKASSNSRDVVWATISGGGGGAVTSVNSQTGDVVLTAANVGARSTSWVPAWTDVTGKPSTFTPAIHSHAIADVTNLQTTLNTLNNADTTLQTNINAKLTAVKSLASATETAATFTIADDGSSTATWPNRFEVLFDPNGATAAFLTFWLNEYGEVRGNPAKSNTVGARFFAGNAPSDYTARDVTVPVLEVSSDRTNRVTKFAVYGDGDVDVAKDIAVAVNATVGGTLNVTGNTAIGGTLAVTGNTTITGTISASNLDDKVVCVPTGTAGFATQPDGTLWIEYTP